MSDLKCPKCKTEPLIYREDALPGVRGKALGCAACGGVWLMPGDIQGLDVKSLDLGPIADKAPADLDSLAGLCPNGHGLLIRAKVDIQPRFYLDKCSLCGGIWFDKGEWQRIVENDLLDHLADFWTTAWQKRRQQERNQETVRDIIRKKLGQDLYEKIDALTRKVMAHPQRAEAEFLLEDAYIDWHKRHDDDMHYESMAQLLALIARHPRHAEIFAHLKSAYTAWQHEYLGESFYQDFLQTLERIQSHPHRLEALALLRETLGKPAA